MSKNVEITREVTVFEDKVIDHYKLKLPEYKQQIIIKDEYVDEVIKQLTLLKNKK